MNGLNEGADRVQNELSRRGFAHTVVELPDSARTAQEAADAIGCEVAQIAKSIIFRVKETDRPLLVVASGVNRINEKRLGKALDLKLGKADADFVRERTGFVIGGVSPIGHKEALMTVIDEDLLQYGQVWAAAGHPKAVFKLKPEELIAMTGGQVMPIG
ncbi:YbaK/EbsC family protein [Paenibacillus doosanensis]|uniref:Cys-tRNA(Pro)/Cys-tRNA(Cys) deacylase YbaK n=1 Tax=Paenibacillus konkukensis TaxID=2020716 RepID=A0ABY4RLN2_9BACL|nr:MULTISPECIES: YbaK/EbsC family protein [Paenibacillus]MCS7463126.1 YbaK/EbsC family protein [Paenibacillus doosanensis]UQZ82967.1 Cys-tRNA(Pro)/Cys-tRNA(Cys) deacylase YbaK [Paenibacillus konkukensis]